MKKFLVITLSLIFSMSSMVLIACDNQTPHEHEYEITSDAKAHWNECSCGKIVEQEAHYGGTATETSKAICEVCGQEYGNLLSPEHSHEYKNLKYDAQNHWYECICGNKSGIEAHKGGTATETEKATCSVCNQKYGNLLTPAHTHYFSKKIATETYLKSTATCKSKAIYYYSCECEEKGSATFESGEIGTHKYEGGNCIYCNKPEQEQVGPMSKSAWVTALSTPINNATLRMAPASQNEYTIYEYAGNILHQLPYMNGTLETENEVYCQVDGSMYFTYSIDPSTGSWIMSDKIDQSYEFMVTYTMINLGSSFKNYYDSFSYDTPNDCYVATNLQTNNETYSSVTICFENGALKSFTALSSSGMSIAVNKIGTTTFSLPENYTTV